MWPTGRQGPVLIDIPVDVSVAKYGTDERVKMKLPGYRIQAKGHKRQLSMVAKAINESEKPVTQAWYWSSTAIS